MNDLNGVTMVKTIRTLAFGLLAVLVLAAPAASAQSIDSAAATITLITSKVDGESIHAWDRRRSGRAQASDGKVVSGRLELRTFYDSDSDCFQRGYHDVSIYFSCDVEANVNVPDPDEREQDDLSGEDPVVRLLAERRILGVPTPIPLLLDNSTTMECLPSGAGAFCLRRMGRTQFRTVGGGVETVSNQAALDVLNYISTYWQSGFLVRFETNTDGGRSNCWNAKSPQHSAYFTSARAWRSSEALEKFQSAMTSCITELKDLVN